MHLVCLRHCSGHDPQPKDKQGIMCAELIVAELRDRFAPVLNNIARAVNQAKETLNAELYGSRH